MCLGGRGGGGGYFSVKARTHRPILRGFSAELATESADYTPESADYTTDSVIVGRLPLSNMYSILNVPESADWKRPTIALGRREMGLVGTGLKDAQEGLFIN